MSRKKDPTLNPVHGRLRLDQISMIEPYDVREWVPKDEDAETWDPFIVTSCSRNVASLRWANGDETTVPLACVLMQSKPARGGPGVPAITFHLAEHLRLVHGARLVKAGFGYADQRREWSAPVLPPEGSTS